MCARAPFLCIPLMSECVSEGVRGDVCAAGARGVMCNVLFSRRDGERRGCEVVDR